jgi:hypothetical protein
MRCTLDIFPNRDIKLELPNDAQHQLFCRNENFKRGVQRHFDRDGKQLQSSLFAVCQTCGEANYLNKDGDIQVNHQLFNRCYSCGYKVK